MRTLLIMFAALGLIACSSQPRSPAAPEAIAQAAAPAAPAQPAAPAAAAAALNTTPGGVRIPYGYKVVVKDGQEMYCRKETILGSRFPQTICLNEDGLRELDARGESVRRNLDRSSATCVGDKCGGG